MSQRFSKEEMKIANKQMIKFSVSLAMEGMHIKVTASYYCLTP